MVTVSGMSKRRRKKCILFLPNILLLLMLPTTAVLFTCLSFFAQLSTPPLISSSAIDFAAQLTVSSNEAMVVSHPRRSNPTLSLSTQTDAPIHVRSSSSTTSSKRLPRWTNTVQNSLETDDQQRSFGRTPPTGSYSLIDEIGCTKVKPCQIHFPLVDLTNMIPFDEMYLTSQGTYADGANTNDATSENDAWAALNETDFPPAIFIPQLLSTKTNDVSLRLPYQDYALLTRMGTKEGYGTANVNQDRILLLSPFSVNAEAESTSSATHTRKNDRNSDWLMGLFDGHGVQGHVTSHFCALDLARVVTEQVQLQLQQQVGEADMAKVLFETILELDRNVPAASLSGATGIVVWKWKDQVAIANAGDSHAYIISYNPMDDSVDILFETSAHKPDVEEEQARIEQLGGEVLPATPEGGTSRVVIPTMSESDGEETLALAMSRCIGDHNGRHVGVIANATVDVLDIPQLMASRKSSDSRLFAIAATDGLMDHLPPIVVARHVARSLFWQSRVDHYVEDHVPTLLEACEQLIRKASQRWKELGVSYRDDISIAATAIS